MNRTEAIGVLNGTVRSLWPDWQINDVEQEVWTKRFYPFDRDVMKVAIENHYAERSFKTPKLSSILEKAAELTHKRGKKKETNESQLVYTIRCVGHERPEMIGKQYSFWQQHQITPDDYSRYSMAAESMHERVQAAYEGTWVIIRDWEVELVPF